MGLTDGSHQKEERRRTDMSGSQRFEQSSQTTTSSHAYRRWPGNAKVFSKLDAKAGFWQIKLEKQSSLRTTFSTPYGKYRFLLMPFGINTASEVFQQAMERLFEGYPCAIIVDDILIWGSTEEEHDANLRKVLERARQIGLKLNLSKCKFRARSVSFVRHTFTDEGLKPDTEKTAAIRNMPAPENQAALQRFLGMTNYLNKFIKDYSEKTSHTARASPQRCRMELD